MMEMVDSVKQYGVLVPALVRPKPDGGYEMLAGHRRRMASELAEKQTLSCIVRDMTDDEATIVMVDSNLQREQILPSEKAFAYKMELDAMKRQGQRTDLTCEPLAHKLSGKKSRDILAEQVGESKDQIRRYIRLTHLIPEILDLVDNSVLKEKDILQIALRPAVELSYLSEEEQQDLVEIMESEDCTPSHAQAIKMRQFLRRADWTPMCCCPSCRRKSLIRWSNSKCPRSVYAHAFCALTAPHCFPPYVSTFPPSRHNVLYPCKLVQVKI